MLYLSKGPSLSTQRRYWLLITSLVMLISKMSKTIIDLTNFGQRYLGAENPMFGFDQVRLKTKSEDVSRKRSWEYAWKWDL